jgi:acyl-CoA thioesterase FadM
VFPWLRLLFTARTFLSAKGKVDLLSTTCIRLRVWPNDLDFNLHVNNGRYLMLADIGRIHWFVKAGVLAAARRRRAFPVVGDSIAKFRRELKAFQTFEIHSRLLGWDDRWGFIEHRFVRGGRVLGVVAVRGIFKGPDGPVKPQELMADLGFAAASPPIPKWAQEFHSGSESLSALLREEEQAQGLR